MSPELIQLQQTIAAQERRLVALEAAARRKPDEAGFNPQFPVFFAKDNGGGEFQEQAMKAGAFVDADANLSRRCTDGADASAIITPASDVIPLMAIPDPDGAKTRFVKIAGGGGNVQWFKVAFASPSTDGDASTAANFVYDVYDFETGAVLIDSAIPVESPEGINPRSVGFRTAANDYALALGYYDGDGDVHLVHVFGETEGYTSCVIPP